MSGSGAVEAIPRARHQPELATERPNNGAITNPCCAVIRPLRRPQVLHRKLTPLPPGPPLTHWRPGRSSGQRSAGLWPSLSRAHDGEGGPRTPFDQADPARSTVLVRTPSGAGRNQATLSGTRPRVQPRLARCPPRALTRWCVARGEGAARCAGRRCGPGGAARHAVSPVRAVPDRRRVGRRPRAVPAR